MIVYVLDKPIDCGKICYDIQKLIDSHNNADSQSDKALVITIRNIIDEIPSVPKLESVPDCPS